LLSLKIDGGGEKKFVKKAALKA